MSLTHALLQRFVEVLSKQGGTAIEECCERSNKCTDETDGNDTFDTGRQNLLNHNGKGCISLFHGEGALLGQCSSYHTWNQEHETRKDFEETGCNCTTACTLDNFGVILAWYLTQYTLNNVLVGTPIPETDDRCTNKYHKAWILLIHRVTLFPVEHVSGTITIVQLSAIVHHVCPSISNIASAESRKTEEQYQERTYNKNRCLNGRKGHYTLHAAKYGENSSDEDQSDGSIPEVKSPEIFKEDTTCERCYTNLGENISHQCDDAQPRTSALCVAEFQEVGHGNNLAHLVNHQLIERYEQPT